MGRSGDNGSELAGASKRMAHRLLIICDNRLQLLMVEAQEERQRLVLAIWLALTATAFGLLAGVALSAIVAVLLWAYSPVLALLTLAALYGIVAALLYARLTRLHKEWQMFSATLDQLRKDRESLEKNLA